MPAEGLKNVAHQRGPDANEENHAECDKVEVVVAGAILASCRVVI